MTFKPKIAKYDDRLPPHSVESEMCVIGSLLLSGNDPAAVKRIRTILRPDDFYQADHQIIFDVIGIVFDRCGGRHDVMLVREELGRRQLLDSVGGTEYLAQIINSVPNASNGPEYAYDVREKATLRRLIIAANTVIHRAYSPLTAEGADEIARDFLAKLHGVAEGRAADSIVRIDRVIDDVIDAHAEGKPTRIRTGLADLDGICGGLPCGRLTVVAGRPGMGKSQLGKQIVRNVATGLPAVERPPRRDHYGDIVEPGCHIPAQPSKPCGIISVEETLEKIGQNYLSAVSRVENNRLAYGTATAAEWTQVLDAAPDIRSLPIYMTDKPVRLADVEGAITTLVTRHHCELVFVDYLQLIHGPDAGTKEQEIARISMSLKNLGKTLGVTVMVAAQLSRANETGGVRRPTLSDLRHSGQIEQDGDLILLLHRPDYYDYKRPDFSPTNALEVIVAKNKDGPLGTAVQHFEGRYQTVTDRTLVDTYTPRRTRAEQELIESV